MLISHILLECQPGVLKNVRLTPKTQTVTSDTSVGGVRSLNLWDVKGLLLTPDISYGDVSSGVITLYQSVKISQTVSLLGVKKKQFFFIFI